MTLANPKISIVTPSFNQGKYIEETITSVLSQSYRNFEYIVMDGGSSDETVSIIKKYDAEIDFWVSERDKGQSDALNRGFARATGDILGWINSDDCLAPGALDAIAAAFTRRDTDIVAGVVTILQDGKLVYRHRTGLRAGPLDVKLLLDLENEWLQGRFFYQPEVYFSRAIYEAAGGMIDTTLHYSMDYDLWVRLARAGARIEPIDSEIARFRMHVEQKTSEVTAYLPELIQHSNGVREVLAMPALHPKLSSVPQRPLRVGMVNDFGFHYGAGRAHRRIAECLASHQVEVLVYAFRDGIDDTQDYDFSDALKALSDASVDVIIVGNVHGAFPKGIALDELAAIAPVLVVTHDFFWFTGRCAYPRSCDAYLFTCPPTCPTRDTYPVVPYEEIPALHAAKIKSLADRNVFLLANSDYLKVQSQRLLAVKGIDQASSEKVRRIHLAVPEPAYTMADQAAVRRKLSIAEDAFVVLTASSSVDDPRKGFRHVLEACRLAHDPRLVVIAIGQISASQVVRGVRYTGYLTEDEDIAAYYQAADLYVSGSSDETFGQTFVEAAMCGCPSLGYKTTGIPEAIVEGETGWVVDLNDIKGLADAIKRSMGQPQDVWERLRRRAHAYAKATFSGPRLISELNEVFRDIVTNPSIHIAKSVQFEGVKAVPIQVVRAYQLQFKMGFGALEGPHADIGIGERLRWQTESVAKIELNARHAGPHRLTLKICNFAQRQALTFAYEGRVVGRVKLFVGEWTEQSEISIWLMLDAGSSDLVVTAERCIYERGTTRELFCAYIAAELEASSSLEGPVSLKRVGKPAPADVTIEQAVPAREPQARDRRLGAAVLGDGYDGLEGPFPDLNIPMRFAWQVEERATFSVHVPAGASAVSLDLAFMCEQTLTISIGATVKSFENLNAGGFATAAHLVIEIDEAQAGWVLVVLEAKNFILDSIQRKLHCALISASSKETQVSSRSDLSPAIEPSHAR